MMHLPPAITREVVLVGGGHTHALLLKKWGMSPVSGARLTVINPTPSATYTGMLPGFVAGHYCRDELNLDLMRLSRFANARMIRGIVTAIDPVAKTITVAGRGELTYDLASIDIGITSQEVDIDGFSEFGVAAKPLGIYANRWTEFLAHGGGPVAVIGAGLGGAELAMAMAFAMSTSGRADAVSLIDQGEIGQELPPRTRRALLQSLERSGVALHPNATVARIAADHVTLADGAEIPARLTVTATGARPFEWLGATGLHLTDGFITVDETLRSTSHPDVFACGDCAHLSHAPRPKAGVFAVREAPVLYDNLRAELTGGRGRPYRPQRDYLKLVSLGGKSALALRSGLQAQGALLWRWKDRIDRAFMKTLTELEPMKPHANSGSAATGDGLADQPLCAGCGAKVGNQALKGTLAKIPRQRDDVETAIGDDAAVLRVGETRQVLTTDHLRDFTGDPALLARIAALHALGDIWAMGARAQAVLASIVLPPLSPRLQQSWLTEVMTAAGEVFGAEGADIVGGHTTQGAELTIGFSVTGLLDREAITLSGGQPGDVLILTRPIGSGVLLAADMALKAKGEDIASLYDTMVRSQGAAAALLRDVHAMTDVTGFGLAGHLAAMAEASGTGAALTLDALPVYDGAEKLAEAGVRSTLFEDNRAWTATFIVPHTPRGDLLFDPQTAGGLLAAVPAQGAAALLENLSAEGFQAARIGQLTPRSEGLRAE